ncbi:site-specific integrase [Kitasatospora cineracea]|uniref:tyrosine-type recombinase/integrase n=1 Tax=Kitasatospora cineracea TaxID=88074 RepID=UPI003407F2DF
MVPEHFCPSESHLFSKRRRMLELLGHLEEFPGHTWQERWEASGYDRGDRQIGDLAGDDLNYRGRLNTALGHAFAMRLIRPSLLGFRAHKFTCYAPWFRSVARDPRLEEFCQRADRLPVASHGRTRAKFDVCCALTVFGIDLEDLTAEAFLYYSDESRKHGLVSSRGQTNYWAGTLAWPVLHEMGQFPPSVPRTLRAAVTRGQLSIEECVDRHRLKNEEVRGLLVEYLRQRSVDLDYSSLQTMTNLLVSVFWKAIEKINPDQADLRLSQETFAAWKEQFFVMPDGSPRKEVHGPLLAIRALYLDIQSWAAAEPERWASWVAPCPIRDSELRALGRRRRELKARMDRRTRDRQPLLPVLTQHVNDKWHRLRALMDAAKEVALGEEFCVDGVTWTRASTRDQRHNRPPIHAINRATGELVRLSREENLAFWQWAIIETLRLAGLRLEELAELTHLSIRQYQRPKGEVVALLVVTPSKSDRERVIPMSAELFHVIAQIIRRHRAEQGTVPVCARYDAYEKVWSEELPHLFQARYGGSQRAMSSTMIANSIRRACHELAPTHPQFAGITFAPHDFRRLFATDLVNNGLPIHIGAALLGHLDVRTTRGYVAVFDEDVISNYQQFLARRRAERPAEEYREPSKEEWADFTEHFDKRRVELGSCGRPYGTPCQHEHACIRCPMLSINPKMLPRLDELEADLLARRERAQREGWRGEIEGLDLTLTFLRGKRAETQRMIRQGQPGSIELGMPMLPSQLR